MYNSIFFLITARLYYLSFFLYVWHVNSTCSCKGTQEYYWSKTQKKVRKSLLYPHLFSKMTFICTLDKRKPQGLPGIDWGFRSRTIHLGIINILFLCVCVLVTQLLLTPWDLMDSSPWVSFVHGILQARMLEWVFPSPGDFPNPIKPRHHSLQADSLPSESPGKPPRKQEWQYSFPIK